MVFDFLHADYPAPDRRRPRPALRDRPTTTGGRAEYGVEVGWHLEARSDLHVAGHGVCPRIVPAQTRRRRSNSPTSGSYSRPARAELSVEPARLATYAEKPLADLREGAPLYTAR